MKRSQSNSLILWLLIALSTAIVGTVVATRGFDIGTDTASYARNFLTLDFGTRSAPIYTWITTAVHHLGFDVTGFQATMFVALMITVVVAAVKLYNFFGLHDSFYKYLAACVMMLFVSPFFVAASVNAIMQGLSASLVLASIVSFKNKQYWQFIILGAAATGFHYSALMYLAMAPLLLLHRRWILTIVIGAFVLYCLGITKILVREFLPTAYTFVIHYASYTNYEAGIRIKFALFSLFFYLVPYLWSKLSYSQYRTEIKDSINIYAIMMIPFFCFGWGHYSSRFAMTAWFAIAFIVASLIVSSRIKVINNSGVIGASLFCSSLIYYCFIYITPLQGV